MSHFSLKSFVPVALVLLAVGGCQMSHISASAPEPKLKGPDVALTEDDQNYTLDNGTVIAKIAKSNGDLISLVYKGLETIYFDPTRQQVVGAAFTETAAQGAGVATKITIDPKSTNGDLAEVSVKGTRISPNNINSDMEFRFTMARGESGIYTYCIYDHPADYPAASWGESRWVARVADFFDWTGEDHGRELVMREVPQAMNGIRYTFAGNWYDHRSYGWASPAKQVGFWLINPSVEYVGGGPLRTDFLCHRDTNQNAPPCILLFSKANHFGGGSSVILGAGEHWTKVIGPFMLYLNSGPDPLTMWKDAEAKAVVEEKKWPYTWVKGVDYVQRDGRADVKGQITLIDPIEPSAKMSNLQVGLTHPDYTPPAGAAGGRGGRGRGAATAPGGAAAPPVAPAAFGPREINWSGDAKYYQFWTRADDNGNFTIPNVIAGQYTLYAVADGVLGEFSKADITVEAGKPIDLGKLTWTPVRHGKQVWEIGVPNYNAREFTYGDQYFDYDSQAQYAKLFPNDVNFVIGKSNTHKDWFYEQLPQPIVDPNAAPATAPARGRGGRGGGPANGRATPYNIRFEMPSAPKGKATLRVAMCGGGGREVDVTVNDKPAGVIAGPGGSDVVSRHGIQGPFTERDVVFDAAMLKQGANVLTLTVPAGPTNSGVLYDYLRLELDENAQAPPQ